MSDDGLPPSRELGQLVGDGLRSALDRLRQLEQLRIAAAPEALEIRAMPAASRIVSEKRAAFGSGASM